jgi:hypothetical protein
MDPFPSCPCRFAPKQVSFELRPETVQVNSFPVATIFTGPSSSTGAELKDPRLPEAPEPKHLMDLSAKLAQTDLSPERISSNSKAVVLSAFDFVNTTVTRAFISAHPVVIKRTEANAKGLMNLPNEAISS